MELTYLGIVLCLLLLAIPACLLFVYDEQLLARGTVAVVRMLAQVAVGGLITYFVIVRDDYRISLLWVLLLEEGQTEAVVELRPEEGTLLPLGLSVRVETDG